MHRLLLLVLLSILAPLQAEADIIIVGHRGASGERPEHTAAAYRLAIEQGAHYVEPDLVMTKDGVLICRHERALAIADDATGDITYRTTDVATRPEFADRLTTKRVGSKDVTGWFAEDFTLAEIKQLRAVEPKPDLRPQSATYDGEYEILTFVELVALAEELADELDRPVGLYPELKDPTWSRNHGLPMEEQLLRELADFRGPVVIQSFDEAGMRRMNELTDHTIGFITSDEDRMSAGSLKQIATFADSVSIHKKLATPTHLASIRKAGLDVYVWTLRAESQYLPEGTPDVGAEARDLADAGVTGLITDHVADVIEGLSRR